ncbi:MAG: hypothetical protein ACK2UK_12865 [Candidatus Promineifilaceae bacterium]
MNALVPGKPTFITAAAAAVLIVFLAVLFYIAGAMADPSPGGTLVAHQEFGLLPVAAGSTATLLMEDALVPTDGQILLTARYYEGELDSGYGLLLQGQIDSLAIAVSPLGYAAVWRQAGNEIPEPGAYVLPWQTWPHVHHGEDSNQILLTFIGPRIEARINNELFWEGNFPTYSHRTGIIALSSGLETTIDFQALDIYEHK